MASETNQRNVFDFLRTWLDRRGSFTMAELKGTTDWTEKTWSTYLQKQLGIFIKKVSDDRYIVSETFRAYTRWNKFRSHVSQVRSADAGYFYAPARNVIIFDFYMPLANEEHLRSTLDSLFYKDTILRKLEWRKLEELQEHFPANAEEQREQFLERICEWISKRFVGYSIHHVNGRFRTAGKLSTREEALAGSVTGDKYLIDETTAVTRFIFPFASEDEANRIRWFFQTLFVDTVKELVSGEDEILMVETGAKNQMHRWTLDPLEKEEEEG